MWYSRGKYRFRYGIGILYFICGKDGAGNRVDFWVGKNEIEENEEKLNNL